MKQVLIGVVLLIILQSCNRTLEYTNPDLNLYPIVDGKERVYQVDETTFTTIDTVFKTYRKKEFTMGVEQDLKNRTVSKLEIYVDDSTGNFHFDQLWTQFRDASFAERIEGNTKFVVLKFPVELKSSWNGNEFNNNGSQYFTYRNLDTIVTLNGISFANCVYVEQRKVTNSLLSDVLSYEIYAPNIGKIKRYDKYYKYDLLPNGDRKLSTDSYVYEENLLSHTY